MVRAPMCSDERDASPRVCPYPPSRRFHATANKPEGKRTKSLGTSPSNHDINFSKNLLPLEPNMHRAYGAEFWAFLPTESVLLAYIAFEERHLRIRESTNPDPGRLPYHHSYTHFPADALFNAFFHRLFPQQIITFEVDGPVMREPGEPFPVRQLIASVNIIVNQAPSFIGTLSNPVARRSMVLASYLKVLWAASPADFRQLERPQSIEFTLDDAEAYLMTVDPVIRGEVLQGIGLGQQGEALNSPVDELEMKLEEYIPGEQGTVNDFSDDSSLHVSNEGFGLEEDKVGQGGNLTSNDQAFMKYRTILGGPILNF
ncbi:hypothetical protein FRB95_011033 [Tulasnella sp. JGI-2019a]|nr:hypothetical protein FRB95_011033 [Tulasnella sp. JGI-2019a]